MLPNLNYGPASFLQPTTASSVALGVCSKLGCPPTPILLRRRPVDRALMPEAAINENCNFQSQEDHIGALAHARNWRNVDSVPQPRAIELSAQFQFTPSISPPHSAHSATRVWRRRGRFDLPSWHLRPLYHRRGPGRLARLARSIRFSWRLRASRNWPFLRRLLSSRRSRKPRVAPADNGKPSSLRKSRIPGVK